MVQASYIHDLSTACGDVMSREFREYTCLHSYIRGVESDSDSSCVAPSQIIKEVGESDNESI